MTRRDEFEQGGNGELVELGQGAALPFPAKGFGLQALTAAVGTGIVSAVAREEDAHMHLVGVLLEPAEEALEAIPVFRPRLAVLLAVAGFAIDDEALLLGGQRGERHVGADFPLLREDEQIFLRIAVDFALPALDRAGVDREGVVGHREAVVDLDDAAEAAAFRAGAERGVEGEQRRRRGAKRAAGFRRMQAARIVAQLRYFLMADWRLPLGEKVNFVPAEVQRGFNRFEEARLLRVAQRDAILHHEEVSDFRERFDVDEEVIDPMHAIADDHAHVGLAFQTLEDFGPGEVFGPLHLETDAHGAFGMGGVGLGPDRLRRVVLDLFSGRGIEAFGDVAEPHFEEIGQLRHRADGGARSLDGVGLLDRDRRADVFDRVHLGLVEQFEELPRVSAESLDVTSLALGVQRVEDQRRFTCAAQAGDDDVAAKWHIEVEALEIVLPDAAQADALKRRTGWHGGGRNHGFTK